MINVTKKFYLPEKKKSFYPGEIVDLGEDAEGRAILAGRAEKSTAKNEKRVKPQEGQKAENERIRLEKKGAAQKKAKGTTVTDGGAKKK